MAEQSTTLTTEPAAERPRKEPNFYVAIKGTRSLNDLTSEERLKDLYWQTRGREHCKYTLRRLYKYDVAVYDQKLDEFFENTQARDSYYREHEKFLAQEKKDKQAKSYAAKKELPKRKSNGKKYWGKPKQVSVASV